MLTDNSRATFGKPVFLKTKRMWSVLVETTWQAQCTFPRTRQNVVILLAFHLSFESMYVLRKSWNYSTPLYNFISFAFSFICI